MKRTIILIAIFALLGWSLAPAEDDPTSEATPAVPDRETLIQEFERTMSGSSLVGYFTINGKEDENGLKAETYHLKSVKKLKHGDFWQFEWQYGKEGKTISLPLEIKWAGDTPVITLTNVLIPGMGKFTARVLFYNHEYAGTWGAADHGGRLFGKVVPVAGQK